MQRSNTDIHDKKTPTFLHYAVLILITTVASVLRFRHSDIRPLWLDEIHTFQVVNQPNSFLNMMHTWWNGFMVSDPPLYYIINWFTVGGNAHASQWGMRLVSIIFGIAVIPATWVCMRQVTSASFALIPAALIAVNTLAVQYGQEYRPYSQLLFFTILYLSLQIAVARSFQWKRWIAMLAAGIMLLYTHYFGGFALAAGYLGWGFVLLITKSHHKHVWNAFCATPLILSILFIPVIAYGVSQARHFSVASGGSSDSSNAMLQMYLSQKAHTNYWTDLPVTLSSYYLGSFMPGTIYLLAMAIAGILTSLILRWRLNLIIILTGIVFVLAGYGFYELMKYPYEPRRSIGALPYMVYFQAIGIASPYLLWKKFAPQSHLKLAAFFPILFFILAIAAYGNQYIAYDANGYRKQSNQADWPGMARYVKLHAGKNELIATASSSGKTWVRSQYLFYHNRYRVSNTFTGINRLTDFQKVLSQSNVNGIWYIVCFPSGANEDLYNYLLSHGHWKTFYGGALVYVPSPKSALGEKQNAIFAPQKGYYAMTLLGKITNDLRVNFLKPENFPLIFSPDNKVAMLSLFEGRQLLTMPSDMDLQTTPILYPLVKPGKWNSAINFSEWKPGSKTGDIVLDNNYEPALYMQYNGSAIYRFYLTQSTTFTLTLEAKNDAPGPIDLRLFVSNGGELEKMSFGRADNSFSRQSTKVRLEKGLNELTVYYPSFRRIGKSNVPYNDTINEFVFSRWRLDLESDFGPNINQ